VLSIRPPLRGATALILVQIAHHLEAVRSDWAQKLKYYLEEQGWWTV
jgi:hypothetical protein